MGFLIDTNIAIDLLDGDDATLQRLETLGGGVMISVATRVELEGGVEKEPRHAAIRRERLKRVLVTLPSVLFDDKSAEMYGSIVASRGYSRRKLIDHMIAAQALVHRATLVTRNAADFSDIPGLLILEW